MISQKLRRFLSQLPQCRRAPGSVPSSARTGAPVVHLHDLRKVFSEAGRVRTVLDGINLSICNGEFVALLGHSGSGKSTLLNLINGIEKPNSGSISITAFRERERTLFSRDHIGFVFQFFNLIPTLTVLENVTLPQELAGRDYRASRKAALNLLLELTRRKEKTLIMATHNPDIAHLADRTFRVHDGTIAEERMFKVQRYA